MDACPPFPRGVKTLGMSRQSFDRRARHHYKASEFASIGRVKSQEYQGVGMAKSTGASARTKGARASGGVARLKTAAKSAVKKVSQVLAAKKPAAAAPKPAPAAKPGPAAKSAKPAKVPAAPAVADKKKGVAHPAAPVAAKKGEKAAKGGPVEKKGAAKPEKIAGPRPRATKLPPMGDALNKRELEQLLTAGQGRGVS